MQSSITQVNDYTKQIAKLNQEITRMTAASGGQAPNDLLDQRDQAVSKLTELVGAKVVVQDGGTYNVFVGNGQPLVMGSDSYDVKAVPSSSVVWKMQAQGVLRLILDDPGIRAGPENAFPGPQTTRALLMPTRAASNGIAA